MKIHFLVISLNGLDELRSNKQGQFMSQLFYKTGGSHLIIVL